MAKGKEKKIVIKGNNYSQTALATTQTFEN